MKDELSYLREGRSLSTREQIGLIARLSIPAIFAQISNVAMQYIDASMVGHLGAEASASIGLVSSTTWLMGGLSTAIVTGFTVQIAQLIGAGRDGEARNVVKHGLMTSISIVLLVTMLAIAISNYLPIWLGADISIQGDASSYFRVYSMALPFMVLNYAAGGMIQCSGEMRIPSIIDILMCVLDVVFNYLLIFPSRYIYLLGIPIFIPGANLQVIGAALGTGLSEMVCSILMLTYLLKFSDKLHLRRERVRSDYRHELRQAIKISAPIAIENLINGGAQVTSTHIVAPLGNVSIAANSFSVTAEALCYMPGYGVSHAATTLIGQSTGAGRKDESRKLSFLTVFMGMALMTFMGILLYIFAPFMLSILTPVTDIQTLGAEVLRIECFAEPFYAASIVTAGVFRGMGKTFLSTIINLSTMWLIRIPLAAFLSTRLGLHGVWIAMMIQLTICGLLFLTMLYRETRLEKGRA